MSQPFPSMASSLTFHRRTTNRMRGLSAFLRAVAAGSWLWTAVTITCITSIRSGRCDALLTPEFLRPRISSSRFLAPKDGEEEDAPQAPEPDLTSQFYKEVRKRGGTQEKTREAAPPARATDPSKEPPTMMPFSTTSSSLFSQPSNRTRPPRSSNYYVDRQREFQLASIFERTLPFQAAALAVALAFVIYVGASGGINSGESRGFVDDEFDDTTMEYLQQIRSDDAANSQGQAPVGGVWL